jgi:large subunit ribosomal protein L15
MADEKEEAPAKKAPAKAAKPAAPAEPKAKPAAADKSAKAPKTPAKPEAKPAKAEPKAAAKSETKASVAKAAAEKPAPKTAKAAPAKPAAKKTSTAKAETEAEPKVQVLKVHHLRPAIGAKTAKTRVGRGEGGRRGKTAGRGTKGTRARNKVPARLEGGQMPLHMRLPKLRGFKNPARVQYQVVNLDRLVELYPEGGTVTSEDLVAKGAVRDGYRVKVLGQGDVSVKLEVNVEACSQSAKDKIVAAGGSVAA